MSAPAAATQNTDGYYQQEEGGSPFFTNFTNADAAQDLFTVDSGYQFTQGATFCSDPQHVFFNTPLLNDTNKRSGLRVTMDTVAPNCSSKAQYSVGHLSSIEYYGYGHYEFEVMPAHAPNGGSAGIDAFTCVSIYNGGELGGLHNEIAVCWNQKTPLNVDWSYWVGWDQDAIHGYTTKFLYTPSQTAAPNNEDNWLPTKTYVQSNLSGAFHTYGIDYLPGCLNFYVDFVLIKSAGCCTAAQVTAGCVNDQIVPEDEEQDDTPNFQTPWELMSPRIILRPVATPSPAAKLTTAAIDVASFSYSYLNLQATPYTN